MSIENVKALESGLKKITGALAKASGSIEEAASLTVQYIPHVAEHGNHNLLSAMIAVMPSRYQKLFFNFISIMIPYVQNQKSMTWGKKHKGAELVRRKERIEKDWNDFINSGKSMLEWTRAKVARPAKVYSFKDELAKLMEKAQKNGVSLPEVFAALTEAINTPAPAAVAEEKKAA